MPGSQKLAEKYDMPSRMWRHGIHNFLELQRHHLPYSLEQMLTFIYLAYSMMALLYETVPAFEITWIECLGDLARYRMAVEDKLLVTERSSRTWRAINTQRAPIRLLPSADCITISQFLLEHRPPKSMAFSADPGHHPKDRAEKATSSLPRLSRSLRRDVGLDLAITAGRVAHQSNCRRTLPHGRYRRLATPRNKRLTNAQERRPAGPRLTSSRGAQNGRWRVGAWELCGLVG